MLVFYEKLVLKTRKNNPRDPGFNCVNSSFETEADIFKYNQVQSII